MIKNLSFKNRNSSSSSGTPTSSSSSSGNSATSVIVDTISSGNALIMNNVSNVVSNMDVLHFFHAEPSGDGQLYLEEVFKQDGIVKVDAKFEEISIPVKPGKYKVTVTNTSRNILKNLKLSVDVTCDQFLDQTDEIARGQAWSTVLKAPFEVASSTIKVLLMLDGNSDYRCRYSIHVHQQYSVIYSQTGVVGNKESNDYETTVLPPGQYTLMAKSANNMPYHLSLACANVMENNSEVKANKMYKSPQILVRNEDNETAAIRVTGIKPREASFELYLLQSVGAFEMKRLEDTEKKRFIEQHNEMLHQLFEGEELEQIGLVCDIVQQRGDGYSSLLNYGLQLKQLLFNIMELKKKAIMLSQSSDDIVAMKQVLDQMDKYTSQTSLKCKVEYERGLLQNAIQILEKEEQFISLLEQRLADGNLSELERLVCQMEDAMQSDQIGSKHKDIKAVLAKANSAVNVLRVLKQSSEKMDRALKTENRDLIERTLKELQSRLTEYSKPFAIDIITKTEETLDHMEKQSIAMKDLKKLVLSKQATSLGYFLSQNRTYLHPVLYQKANTILHSLLQNQSVDLGQFLEEMNLIEEEQRKTNELRAKELIEDEDEKNILSSLEQSTENESDSYETDEGESYESELSQTSEKHPDEDIDVLALVDETYSDDEDNNENSEHEEELLRQMLEEDAPQSSAVPPEINNSIESLQIDEPEEKDNDDEYSEEMDVELTDDEADTEVEQTTSQTNDMEEYEDETEELSSVSSSPQPARDESVMSEKELEVVLKRRDSRARRSVRARSVVDMSQILQQQHKLMSNQSHHQPSTSSLSSSPNTPSVQGVILDNKSADSASSESSGYEDDYEEDGTASVIVVEHDTETTTSTTPTKKTLPTRSKPRSISIKGRHSIQAKRSTSISITSSMRALPSPDREEVQKMTTESTTPTTPISEPIEAVDDSPDLKTKTEKSGKGTSKVQQKKERRDKLEEKKRKQQELFEQEALLQKQREEEEKRNKEQEKEDLVQRLKESQQEEMVKKFKKGYVPIQFQRKAQLSHPLLDRLHLLLLQMIHANQNNIVTAETPFALNIVKILYEILTYKTKTKMFFRERTLYDIFYNFRYADVQNALKYFELREFAKKDSFNPPSIVFLQFILESGDFVPFVQRLMESDMYLDTCYDKLSIICNKFYREDLMSELMLLTQVKFSFGYLPMGQTKEQPKLKSKSDELQNMKQVSKKIVQFFISKTENHQVDLNVLGNEWKTREIGTLVRYDLCPAIESACHHGIRFKNYGSGQYHIWNVIEASAARIRQKTSKTTLEEEFLSTISFISQKARISESDYLYRDIILFTLFVCISMNQRQLANYFHICLGDPRIVREFYDVHSLMSDDELREKFILYLKPFAQLPFNLRL